MIDVQGFLLIFLVSECVLPIYRSKFINKSIKIAVEE
jgi:hypothetical protein